MKIIAQKTQQLQGAIMVPGSKSHTIRGLMLALMAQGQSRLINALDSEDTQNAIAVCQSLGAKIVAAKNSSEGLELKINALGLPLATNIGEIFSGNSGITTTFVLPLLGLRQNYQQKITLKCGEQMMNRPLGPIIDALNQLGMEAKSLLQNGSCPIEISGSLKGGTIRMKSQNSQPLSALLMALPSTPQDSEIMVEDLQERPYIEMTLKWLDELKIKYSHDRFSQKNLDIFKIFGNQNRQHFVRQIPGDFSSASYFLAAASLIPGEVILKGLDFNDAQGDKKLIDILKNMGADIQIEQQTLKIKGGEPLHGLQIDCGDFPDLIPTLAVIATQAEGETHLINAAHARIKETDRLASMTAELKRMGAHIEEHASSLIIHKSKLYCAKVHGYKDHRTIMALAVAGMMAVGKTEIDTAENIKKTFPNFVELMSSLGAHIETIS